ncbi:hypothetical protein LTR53_000918 [Teratosphaeriaceae sp. CCFEE 6253]|nr:hypothetical protein LTR53_000918 [Teratosphaeriaceae sp. CCFEE 6253]
MPRSLGFVRTSGCCINNTVSLAYIYMRRAYFISIMDFVDELECMAANAAWASATTDEDYDDNSVVVARWQSIFGYTPAEAAASIAEQREDLTALVLDALWQVVQRQQERHGHDRASCSHWLRLRQRTRACVPSVVSAASVKSRNQQCLLRMDGPLSSAETVAAIGGLSAPPKISTGCSGSPSDSKTRFCHVDSKAKEAIVRWLALKHPPYRPLFVAQTLATKDFCQHFVAPTLGRDATLPQYRLEDFVDEARPRQDEYPVWYFFYGTLANTDTLQRLFRHIDGDAEKEYSLYPAKVAGAELTTWADTYKALVDGTSEVTGSAFSVESQEHEDTLRSYETSAYEVVRCEIQCDRPGGETAALRGCTFRFVGS